MNRLALFAVILGMFGAAVPNRIEAQRRDPSGSQFPPFQQVVKGYEKVVSTADGKPSMYSIWVRRRDGQMLAELPANYARHKYFVAMTIASGDRFAGLQVGDVYVYWKRYDTRLALIMPNTSTRSSGDQESKGSVKRLFTDRVLLEVPIVTLGARGGPVIDMDALLVGQSSRFFGRGVQAGSRSLVQIKKAKAFPGNVELAFEVPMRSGILKTLHYSISRIPDRTGYKPRYADERVGYFTTAYRDLGNFSESDTWNRYINRWKLEKRDSSLDLSPPKNPIVFYIEHSTPVRYRRWVREGILAWNKAFEKVGILDAIQVHQQDALSGDHMEKDPEDVRYNFVRWLNNEVGVAIGPSRVHPMTGQILDADIILTDGWIRRFGRGFREELPKAAMEAFDRETLSWLQRHPRWDPRIRLADPSERTELLAERAREMLRPHAGHPLGNANPNLLGDDEYDGLMGRTSQVNGMCLAAVGKAFDLSVLRASLAYLGDRMKDKEPLLDGVPERFMGPLVADLVSHEVGHTLGLRHNFKASGLYRLEEINSDKLKGQPFASSVMDYHPININMSKDGVQGEYAMIGIGPYDEWAIEYGYSLSNDLKPILARVADPALEYGTDEDVFGPDPLAGRYDLGSDPLVYANNLVELARHHRGRILKEFVKDGESWARARHGYQMTLIMQIRAVSVMSRWLGGAFIRRDKKGDKDGRSPVEVVSAETQREALRFVITNGFYDEAFGLTPELLRHMSADKWLDLGGFREAFQDTTWPVHDRVVAIQSAFLTMIMKPSTLTRVYDNELRTEVDQDMITLPELLDTISSAIWSELDDEPAEKSTSRKPLISSLRRNLQREHLDRMIDLCLPGAGFDAAYKPISNLAMVGLRKIQGKITNAFAHADRIDPYTLAHLSEANLRIDNALDADYIYNTDDIGGSTMPFLLFFKEIKAMMDREQAQRELEASWKSEPTPVYVPSAPVPVKESAVEAGSSSPTDDRS
ncbi:MAG: zinc-dependent metalloprotease [Planctomycetes bacterium]|nr:zinc-dependent metalloprotease [Planctomycetota bacterium]